MFSLRYKFAAKILLHVAPGSLQQRALYSKTQNPTILFLGVKTETEPEQLITFTNKTKSHRYYPLKNRTCWSSLYLPLSMSAAKHRRGAGPAFTKSFVFCVTAVKLIYLLFIETSYKRNRLEDSCVCHSWFIYIQICRIVCKWSMEHVWHWLVWMTPNKDNHKCKHW